MKKVLTVAALLLTAMIGTATAGEKFDLKIDSKAAKVSAKAVAKVVITPKGEFHVNTDFPAKLKITGPSDVKIEKATLTVKDAAKLTKDVAEFDIAFTAETPGKKVFTGEVKFAVCTATDCLPQTQKIEFTVDVKD
jgi:hypothetical protein